MTYRILIVDDSLISLKLAGDTLAKEGHQIFTAKSGREALAVVDEMRPDLIILDVLMPEMDGYDVCQALRQRPGSAQTPIMMLTAQDTLEEKIKGFEAGADDYMIKPFQPPELQARVRVLLRRIAPPAAAAPSADVKMQAAKKIALFSLKGGVGVSSLAANITAGLTAIWGQPAVLVDLALVSGQAAFLFNISPRNTWADLAGIDVDEIDTELVMKILLRSSEGGYILAVPPKPEHSELITPQKVTHVVNLLARQVPYLVMDLPHDFSETTLAALDSADEILVIMAPELASVMAMRSTLDAYEALGYIKRKKVRVVLNQTFDRHCLARKSIEGALKRPIDLVIPHAPDAFIPGMNRGVPPIISAPTSPLGGFLEDIAFYLSRPEHRGQTPDNPTTAWHRANQRYQQRIQKK